MCRIPVRLITSCLIALLMMTDISHHVVAQVPAAIESEAGKPTIRLVGAGDIASCDGTAAIDTGAELTARLVEGLLAEGDRLGITSYAFTIGDNTYPVGAETEFDVCYRPTWGRFRDRTFPALGNHDRGNGSGDLTAPGFYGFFDARLKDIDRRHNNSTGVFAKGYYKVRLSDQWLLLILDSTYSDTGETKFPDPAAMFREEETWLKQVLADKPRGQCVIAVWHHPICPDIATECCNREMEGIWRLLQKSAGLVITGHEHTYRRYVRLDGNRRPARDGLLQITVGTGGRERYENPGCNAFSDPGSPRPADVGYGVIALTLRGDQGEYRFVPVSSKSTPAAFDQGTFACPKQ